MDSKMITKRKDPKYNNSPEYNKMYYAKHKSEILATIAAKCKCDLCGRTVSYQRLNLHKKAAICFNHRPTNPELIKLQED